MFTVYLLYIMVLLTPHRYLMIFYNLSDIMSIFTYWMDESLKCVACQWFKKNGTNALTSLQGRMHMYCNNSYELPMTVRLNQTLLLKIICLPAH